MIMNSFCMHMLAMFLMLCDHLWATVIPGNMWLTNLGRIAFPLFAFLLVEGYFHTKNLKNYLLRLLVGALISEIPFNLMYGGGVFYPYHQNVMWTFLISILCIYASEKQKERHWLLRYALSLAIFMVGCLAAFAGMVDYYGFGVLTVAVFYFFRGNAWWKRLLQLAGLYLINVRLLGGMTIDVNIGGFSFEIVQQGLALLAMIPIALYNHQQGPHNRVIQYACYLFYPAHMLILSLIALHLV